MYYYKSIPWIAIVTIVSVLLFVNQIVEGTKRKAEEYPPNNPNEAGSSMSSKKLAMTATKVPHQQMEEPQQIGESLIIGDPKVGNAWQEVTSTADASTDDKESSGSKSLHPKKGDDNQSRQHLSAQQESHIQKPQMSSAAGQKPNIIAKQYYGTVWQRNESLLAKSLAETFAASQRQTPQNAIVQQPIGQQTPVEYGTSMNEPLHQAPPPAHSQRLIIFAELQQQQGDAGHNSKFTGAGPSTPFTAGPIDGNSQQSQLKSIHASSLKVVKPTNGILLFERKTNRGIFVQGMYAEIKIHNQLNRRQHFKLECTIEHDNILSIHPHSGALMVDENISIKIILKRLKDSTHLNGTKFIVYASEDDDDNIWNPVAELQAAFVV